MRSYSDMERLRSYSTIFSSNAFLRLIGQGDFDFINRKIERFDTEKFKNKEKTYNQYLQYIYQALCNGYRCEYIYKNQIINDLLLKKYKLSSTIAINEFRVGNSIVDIAMFNGISRAFEIKTELDSDKRLNTQLIDYEKLFDECYIVTHESLVDKYLNQKDDTGIIVLYKEKNCLKLKEIRSAKKNNTIDCETLIRCLRTTEYKNIIENFYGEIPDVSSFKMFDTCLLMMKRIPADELHTLMMTEFKKRKIDKNVILSSPKVLKHICLSLNMNFNAYSILNERLNQYII
ncbi:MAG: sce7726 family protein [Tannerella sp.]|nr:sce7726 family protein [Tannerella sp.]